MGNIQFLQNLLVFPTNGYVNSKIQKITRTQFYKWKLVPFHKRELLPPAVNLSLAITVHSHFPILFKFNCNLIFLFLLNYEFNYFILKVKSFDYFFNFY